MFRSDADPWANTSPPSELSDMSESSIAIEVTKLMMERQTDGQKRTTDAIQRQISALTAQVQQIATAIPLLSFPPPTPPTAPLATPPTTSSAAPRPQVATPEAFDGDRTKGRAFLTSCHLYLSLRGGEFRDDHEKIRWILSYMKIGRAATFAQRLLRNEMQLGVFPFPSLPTFLAHLEKEFCVEDELTTALTTLESTRYFQGRKSVNEYIDDFQELIDLAGCTDYSSVVMKFRRGLDPIIEKHLAVSENPIPVDGLQAWYDRARRYDASQRTHDAFVAGNLRSTPQHGFSRGTFPKTSLPPFTL